MRDVWFIIIDIMLSLVVLNTALNGDTSRKKRNFAYWVSGFCAAAALAIIARL